MAIEYSRFFDSVGGDRTYSADEFAEFFRSYFASGVLDLNTNLQVSVGSGLSLGIADGSAIVYGYGYWLKTEGGSSKTLSLTAAAALPRLDRIVLRLDKSIGTRSVVLAVLPGTPAASPSAPALTRSGNIYELSLAKILIPANAVSLVAENLTDERADNALCGIVEPLKIREYIDQAVKSTSSPSFAGLNVSGTVTADKVIGAVYQ